MTHFLDKASSWKVLPTSQVPFWVMDAVKSSSPVSYAALPAMCRLLGTTPPEPHPATLHFREEDDEDGESDAQSDSDEDGESSTPKYGFEQMRSSCSTCSSPKFASRTWF